MAIVAITPARRTRRSTTAWRWSICRPASSTSPSTAGAEGLAALRDEIAVLRPREIVVAAGHDMRGGDSRDRADVGVPVTEIEGWHFELESARQTLLDQLRVSSLEGFGLERRQAAVCAAGALVRYLRDTQKADLAHVRTRAAAAGRRRPADRSDDAQAPRDRARRSTAAARGSLLDEIDRTVTPMGGRLLRTWLLRPLTALEADSRSARRRRGAGASGPPIAASCARR